MVPEGRGTGLRGLGVQPGYVLPVRAAVVPHACAGLLYRDGVGVERNDAEAVKWLRVGAEGGRAAAQAGLGTLSQLTPICFSFPE